MRPTPRKEVGVFKIDGSPCRLIDLTKGFWAIVSEHRYEELKKKFWKAVKNRSGKYYVTSNEKGKTVYMHHLICACEPGKQRDHENGNTLDNRDENVRQSTKTQNNCNVGLTRQNTSGLKGARRDHGGWRSDIRVDGKLKFLGYFKTKEEAHEAYCKAAVLYHGEFANFG
jgi:hypothetical protein